MRPGSFRASVEDCQSARDWSSGGTLRTPEKSWHRLPHRSGIHRHVWRRCSLCVVGNRIGPPGPGHGREMSKAPTGNVVNDFHAGKVLSSCPNGATCESLGQRPRSSNRNRRSPNGAICDRIYFNGPLSCWESALQL